MMLFWKDKWCGLTPLSVAYPILYAIVISKDALVLWLQIFGA